MSQYGLQSYPLPAHFPAHKVCQVSRPVVVAVLLCAMSCSTPPAAVESAAADPEDALVPALFDSLGVLEGEVRFQGLRVPRSTSIQNTTDPQHCGRIQSLRDIVVSEQNHGVRDVIVAVIDVPVPADYRPPTSRLILDNRACQFEPHAAVVTIGSQIEAVNSDPVFHSVHFYGAVNRNLGLGPRQRKVIRTLSRPGLYTIKCDVHGWMQSFVRVDAHPFHATSDGAGRFRIEGIPAGSYRLEAWHERFGTKEKRVTIEPGGLSRVTILFRDQTP